MEVEKRIKAFSELGKALKTSDIIQSAAAECVIKNPWFIKENVEYSINTLADNLTESNLREWAKKYNTEPAAMKTIAVIMAGNIPLVGFHDFLCVLISGHRIVCKLSSNDNVLLPAIAKVLASIDNEFERLINFAEGRISNFDAVIATGSNNTSRYFDYYFGKYPHIIRHNRNSIGILSGNENAQEFEALCDDIFLHFGLGCRSVNKIYVPRNYNFDNLIAAAKKYEYLFDHHIYKSNLDYHKALLLLNNVAFIDGGFWMLKEDTSMYSPESIINFEYYDKITEVTTFIENNTENIQCVVAKDITNAIAFGNAQKPTLTDYADGVDTMEWLASI